MANRFEMAEKRREVTRQKKEEEQTVEKIPETKVEVVNSMKKEKEQKQTIGIQKPKSKENTEVAKTQPKINDQILSVLNLESEKKKKQKKIATAVYLDEEKSEIIAKIAKEKGLSKSKLLELVIDTAFGFKTDI